MEDNVVITADQQEDLYILYIHTCLANDKVYVGITSKDANDRWLDGESYKGNSDLYADIKKFGWESGFHHKIVGDSLSWEKAKESEKFLIETFEATDPQKGYNHRKGNNRQGVHRERANIGTKIQVLRKNRGITQFDLADALGLSRATISNYEVNRRSPSIDELKRFADFFGVGLDYFGTDATDESFEISSRVKGYFKNENVSYDEKVELFNDLLSTYYLYVIDKN